MEQVAVVAAAVILIFIGPALQYLVAEKSYLYSFDMLCLHQGYCNIDQNIHYGQNKHKITHYKGKCNSITWLGDSVPQTRPDQLVGSAVQVNAPQFGMGFTPVPLTLPACLVGWTIIVMAAVANPKLLEENCLFLVIQ